MRRDLICPAGLLQHPPFPLPRLILTSFLLSIHSAQWRGLLGAQDRSFKKWGRVKILLGSIPGQFLHLSCGLTAEIGGCSGLAPLSCVDNSRNSGS